METVKDILATKGSEVLSIDPEVSLFRGLEKMVERNVGALLVIDASGKVCGLFSERDVVRKIVFKGRDCDNTTVREVMSTEMFNVETKTSLSDCMNLMTERRLRHLPVTQNGKIVGIVSIGDIVKAVLTMKDGLISQQAFELGQYERFVAEGSSHS
ncbi:MAG: CBS domain-containing protein [Spirochaetales bacterium]